MRCATRKTVVSAMRPRMASWTRPSVATSSALVRVVEDEDPRSANQRARDPQSLALAAGEVRAAALHLARVAVGPVLDERSSFRRLRRGHDVDMARIVFVCPEPDVALDRAAEQARLLQHSSDRLEQRCAGHVAHVDAVDRHSTPGDVVGADDEVDERRLSRPGRDRGSRRSDPARRRGRCRCSTGFGIGLCRRARRTRS